MTDAGMMYAGETDVQHRLKVVNNPTAPAAVPKSQTYDIAYQDGQLYEADGTYEDIEIPVEFDLIGPADDWPLIYRGARRWLLQKCKGHHLILDANRNIFYKVKNVRIEEITRTSLTVGKFTTVFTCDAYEYLRSGMYERTAEDVKYNPYSTAKPVYKITGNGSCTLTVNGKTMKATVGQNLTIDTERMLAYREDGTMMNTSVTGDYEDLYLQPGENEISITSGFGLSIIPNWRCV